VPTESLFQNDRLDFADVCGGKGGFTEYIMHRCGTHLARGWGITLRSDGDRVRAWALEDFAKTAPHSNFEISFGADGTGDITKQANADAFVALVAEQTKQRMLALVLADGAVAGDDDTQSTPTLLALAQLYVALMLIRDRKRKFACWKRAQ
jgi:hypothetical protein